ncbi:hypothetical protein C6341_g13691 [Phytophthora cactorum]|nr:hypothetical protein C6341_g13691 [Phytophthora cactorum]
MLVNWFRHFRYAVLAACTVAGDCWWEFSPSCFKTIRWLSTANTTRSRSSLVSASIAYQSKAERILRSFLPIMRSFA